MSDRIDLDDWRKLAKPRSKWRRRARAAIVDVVNENCGVWGSNPRVEDARDIADKIDGAYPFGHRNNEPYKAWLIERKLIRQALGLVSVLPLPGPDEVAACMVAADLLESSGDEVAVRELLDEQAPNRLNAKCLSCGAKPRKPCFEKESQVKQSSETLLLNAVREGKLSPKIVNLMRQEFIPIHRLIPHEARLGITPRNTHDGPLFGGLPA